MTELRLIDLHKTDTEYIRQAALARFTPYPA